MKENQHIKGVFYFCRIGMKSVNAYLKVKLKDQLYSNENNNNNGENINDSSINSN